MSEEKNLVALTDLATAINAEHTAIEEAFYSSVDHAVRAGELLIEAKSQIEYGQWSTWLKTNFRFSERTARNYMRVARELPQLDDAKRQHVAVLPLREALSAIGSPKPTPLLTSEPENNDYRPETYSQKGQESSPKHQQWLADSEVCREDELAPPTGKMAIGRFSDEPCRFAVICEMDGHPGYYHTAVFNTKAGEGDHGEGYVDYLKKGILQDYVKGILDRQGLNPADAEWEIINTNAAFMPWAWG